MYHLTWTLGTTIGLTAIILFIIYGEVIIGTIFEWIGKAIIGLCIWLFALAAVIIFTPLAIVLDILASILGMSKESLTAKIWKEVFFLNDRTSNSNNNSNDMFTDW